MIKRGEDLEIRIKERMWGKKIKIESFLKSYMEVFLKYIYI